MEEKTKKLYRSRTERVVFGVCGGLGKYFNIDPILFRFLFILLFLADGIGLFLYIIMAVIVPVEPKKSDHRERDIESEIDEFADKIGKKAEDLSDELKFNEKFSSSQNALGVIVILIGLFFLSRETFNLDWINTDLVWPFAIIAVGLYIIFKKQ